MANPQKENGYLALSLEIMDALVRTRIPGEARQVLDCIIRKTYGWNKRKDVIALSQFVATTGLTKPHIIRCIKKLQNMNIIIAQKGNKNGTTYGLQKNYDKWIALPKKATLPKKAISVAHKGNSSLPIKGTTKDTTTKDTTTKDRGAVFPEKFITPEFDKAWKEWEDYRKEKKSKLTPLSIKKQVKFLSEYPVGTAIEMINQSIRNGWTGIFDVKHNRQTTPSGQGQSHGQAPTSRNAGEIEYKGGGKSLKL